MNSKALRVVWLALGLVLFAAVIVWAGPAETLNALAQSRRHPGLLAGAVALFVATQGVFLLKWHWMSCRVGAGASLRQSLRLFGTLMLVGTFTPGRAGELVVPLLMRGGGRLTGVALINRLLESTGTLCAGLLALALLLSNDPRSARVWNVGPVLALFVAILVVLSRRRYTAAILKVGRRVLMPLTRFGPVARLLALEERCAADLDHFYAANERLVRLGPIFVFALLMALIWGLVVSGNYLIIQATVPEGGKEVTFLVVMAVVAASAVAMFVSPIPGGLGLSEFTAVALLGQLGYEPEAFVPFLLLMRLVFYAVVILLYTAGRVAGQDLAAPAAATALAES
ncbi:MAG: lysylphosphatidylglycerol synthase transmembrane domain-containing protein [Planctomycetota bacterium]|nr:lysylphosphatidylglycerol synthase transmembrane domain-containing protein [Planctomycetota bacterium]